MQPLGPNHEPTFRLPPKPASRPALTPFDSVLEFIATGCARRSGDHRRPRFVLPLLGGEGRGEGGRPTEISPPRFMGAMRVKISGRSLPGRPQCAKRTSLTGQLIRGGLGKPLGRGEGGRHTEVTPVHTKRPRLRTVSNCTRPFRYPQSWLAFLLRLS